MYNGAFDDCRLYVFVGWMEYVFAPGISRLKTLFEFAQETQWILKYNIVENILFR